MWFFFNAKKGMQAAAALLRSEETRQTSYLRLLKLLYIADRESVRDTGRPITGDAVVAMDHGPVLTGMYDLVKMRGYQVPVWSKYFQVSGYHVKLTHDPGVGMLSRYELEKLREVSERYAAKTDWDIVEDTHQFEEWKRNYAKSMARPIPPEHILEAVGRAEDIPELQQDEKDRAEIDRLLKGC